MGLPLTEDGDRASFNRAAIVVVVGYAASRAFYAFQGVSVDLSPLSYFWQYLDLDLLRNDVWRSVFYDHAQPPLFNLWLGLHLQFADAVGLEAAILFQASAWAIGALMHLAVFVLSSRLGVSHVAAAAVALLWACSPASVLYEHWLFYSAPVAATLLGVFVFSHRALSTGRRRDFVFAFLCAAAVVLGRSLFHMIWLAAIVGAVVAHTGLWRRALACAVVPCLLAGSVYAKNLALYDQPVASTWLGMSVAKLAVADAPTALRERLRRVGSVSELSLFPPFDDLRDYPPSWRAAPPAAPDHPAVQEAVRSSGYTNYHHAAYIHISAAYLADARALVAADSSTYRQNVAAAARLFWKSTTDNPFLEPNRARIAPLARAYDALWGVPRAYTAEEAAANWSETRRVDVAWAWLSVVVLSALWGVWVVLGRRRETAAVRGTLALVIGTVLYVMVVSTLTEVEENNRFRFAVEPACLALIAAAGARLRRRLGPRR